MVPLDSLPADGLVDIFALHSRLNLNEHLRVLHRDSVFITIARDPVSLFESLYSYYNVSNYFDGAPLEEFLKFPLQVILRIDVGLEYIDLRYKPLHKAIEPLSKL